jgi:multiple sugar transport system permease protein
VSLLGRRLVYYVPRYLVLVVITIAFVFPLYWMVVLSLDGLNTPFSLPPKLWPDFNFGNFADAWNYAPWPRYFLNTFIVAGGTMIMVIVTSVLAGYAFASMSFPGKALVFACVLGMYMVPQEITLVPNYVILTDLHWMNSFQAQIVPFGASIFGIFLMRQFFLTLPKDLWEAAQLDGIGHFKFLWLIALPLARPAVITVALFHFVAGWNSFLWPLIVTSDDRFRPIQVGLSSFAAADSTQPVLLAAGALMTTLPILVIFLFAQKQLVGGIAATGIRG